MLCSLSNKISRHWRSMEVQLFCCSSAALSADRFLSDKVARKTVEKEQHTSILNWLLFIEVQMIWFRTINELHGEFCPAQEFGTSHLSGDYGHSILCWVEALCSTQNVCGVFHPFRGGEFFHPRDVLHSAQSHSKLFLPVLSSGCVFLILDKVEDILLTNFTIWCRPTLSRTDEVSCVSNRSLRSQTQR